MTASWQRFGAVTALLGGVLAVIFNVAHTGPRRGNTRLFLQDLVASRIWEADHLGIAVALLMLLAALLVLARMLSDGPAAPWALAAAGLAMAGTAVALVNVAIDGPAMQEVADRWSAARGARQESLFAAAEVLRAVDIALFSTWTLVLIGATPIVFAAALWIDRRYPAWLAPLGASGGAVGVATAGYQWFVGLKPVTVFVLFPVASALLALWIISLGVIWWRRSVGNESTPRTAFP